MACMDICEQEGLYSRAKDIEGYWQEAVHSLKGLPHVKDIRNIGLMAGIELVPEPEARWLVNEPGTCSGHVLIMVC